MNLQERKISFVQEVLKINDMDIIIQLEVLLQKEMARLYNSESMPMSIEEFTESINRAEEDYKH